MTWYTIYAIPWPCDSDQGQRLVAVCYSEEKAVQIATQAFNWNLYAVQLPEDAWGKQIVIPMTIPVNEEPKVEVRDGVH